MRTPPDTADQLHRSSVHRDLSFCPTRIACALERQRIGLVIFYVFPNESSRSVFTEAYSWGATSSAFSLSHIAERTPRYRHSFGQNAQSQTKSAVVSTRNGERNTIGFSFCRRPGMLHPEWLGMDVPTLGLRARKALPPRCAAPIRDFLIGGAFHIESKPLLGTHTLLPARGRRRLRAPDFSTPALRTRLLCAAYDLEFCGRDGGRCDMREGSFEIAQPDLATLLIASS